jgi:hypothetical protein
MEKNFKQFRNDSELDMGADFGNVTEQETERKVRKINILHVFII